MKKIREKNIHSFFIFFQRPQRQIFFFFLAVLLAVLSPLHARALTGDELLHRVQENFLKQNIKTLSYVENRIVFTKVRENSQYNGTIPFNKKNVTRHKLNYYYKAPNLHKYKLLTDPINATEIQEANQATVEMDEEWEKRIRENYNATLLPDQNYRGRKCYVLNLIPKTDSRLTVPMTWLIDKRLLLVLKFISLSSNSVAGKLSMKGELYYKKIKGTWLLSSAHWVQTPTSIPHTYEFKVFFANHKINKPISDSVFKK